MFNDRPHDPLSFINVGQFATPEHDRHDDLVFVLQESLRLVDLEIDVVLAGLGTESYFLDFRLVDVGAMEFLFLLILELAEVHDPADGRFLVRGNLDQIKPSLPSASQRLVGGDDPELASFGGDHADRGNPDLLVDAMVLIDGLRLRTPTNCQVMPRDGGTVNLTRFPRSPESRQAGLPTDCSPDIAAKQAPSGLIRSQVRHGTDSPPPQNR